MEKGHCFAFLQMSLMSGLKEDNYILIIASVFILLESIVLVQVFNIRRKSVITQICS